MQVQRFLSKVSLVFMVASIPTIRCECDVCGLSGVACTGLTEFHACFNGLMVTSPSAGGSCPANTYCNENTATICAQPDHTVMPSCIPDEANSQCGVCSANGRFACVNATAFGFCFGEDTVSRDILINCPVGQYCNVNETAPGFCTADAAKITCMNFNESTKIAHTTPTSTIAPPTTTSLPNTTSTIPISNNATALCLSKRSVGRFALPLDTTCKSYYYCFVNKYAWRGQTFDCTWNTYFNPEHQRCIPSNGYACFGGRLVVTTT